MKAKSNKFKEFNNMVFKDSVGLIRKCGLNLVIFELIYKLVALAILIPGLSLGFKFTLKKAGFKYLTNNYILTYMKSPLTIAFIIIVLFFAVIYITYEVACLSVCFDAGYHGYHIAITGIFRSGIKLMRSSMRKKKINAVFHVVSVTLVMNITLLGFMLSNITIPDAARKTMQEHYYIFIIAGVLFLAFFIYCMLHIFIMNYMAYDGDDITDCKRRSRSLIKHRGFKTFLVMLVWNISILVGIYFIYFILGLIISIGVGILDKANLGMAIYLQTFKIVLLVIKGLMIFLATPVSFGIITSLFFRYRGDTGNKLNMGEISECITNGKALDMRKQKKVAWGIIVVVLTVNVFEFLSVYNNNPFSNVEYFSETEIMAHRGCSYNAPENTALAFENALEATADYIELDVHETKDGEIIVMHDSNLKRTTGVNKNIWNVTYDEIKDLDAGSYFGNNEKFSECRIPTLRDVMKFADNRIKLNIEIKLSNKEPDLVKKVAELIEEYKFEDQCVVTSMNYEALTEIKKYNPDIKTGYVLTAAYGSFYNIENVDAFSINSAYVNKNLVDAIHNRGKKIYVWTVNSKTKVKDLSSMGVDAIITDNPVMAREVAYSRYSNTLFENVLSYVFDR